jgi:hypothetical protein
MDLKNQPRQDHRCCCESFVAATSAKRSKAIIPPPQIDPGTLRLYVFARACPTSASCHHRLRNLPFSSHHFPSFFFFARSSVAGLGTRAPHSAVPKSLSLSQSLSASPNFFFTSRTIRFFGTFSKGPARQSAPTLVSFRSMQPQSRNLETRST